MTSHRMELSLGFLSRQPRSQREWLSLRLLSLAQTASRSFDLPCSSVVLWDVPFEVTQGSGLGRRPHVLRPDHYSRSWGSEVHVDLSHPLSLVSEEETGATVTRPFPEVPGPSLALSARWSYQWVGDWESGAGVVRPFALEVTPVGLSSAQLEVLTALRSDGMPFHQALQSALALV